MCGYRVRMRCVNASTPRVPPIASKSTSSYSTRRPASQPSGTGAPDRRRAARSRVCCARICARAACAFASERHASTSVSVGCGEGMCEAVVAAPASKADASDGESADTCAVATGIEAPDGTDRFDRSALQIPSPKPLQVSFNTSHSCAAVSVAPRPIIQLPDDPRRSKACFRRLPLPLRVSGPKVLAAGRGVEVLRKTEGRRVGKAKRTCWLRSRRRRSCSGRRARRARSWRESRPW